MVFITEGFFEVAVESWPEGDLNPQPLRNKYIYINGKVTCDLDQSYHTHFPLDMNNLWL